MTFDHLSIGEYIFQVFKKKLLFEVDIINRDPQLVKVPRIINCGMFNLKWEIYTTLSSQDSVSIEEGVGRIKSQKQWMSSGHSMSAAHMNS